MGFFKAMGRIMQGKPVFDESEGVTEIHSSGMNASPHLGSEVIEAQAGEHDGIIKNTPSTFPIVRIEGFHGHSDGQHYEVRVEIKNDWQYPVMVQTVRAFGTSTTLGVPLQPHQAREALIYRGPVFPRQPGYEILLEYKSQHEGDYFQSINEVRYSYNSTAKTYEVSDIQLRLPIRDIYG